MDRNIVILAGGASSRMKKSVESHSFVDSALRDEAQTKSKAMIGLGENARPFLDYLLSNVEKAGYQNVVIVVEEKDDSVREYYKQKGKSKQFPSLKIAYVVQIVPAGREKPLGTADALRQALKATPSWKGQCFTVCNSDNLYSQTALRFLLEDSHENAMIDYDRGALRFNEGRVSEFAVIVKDDDGFLKNIVEKPSIEEMNCAKDSSGRIGVSMNIWRFSYDYILPFLESVPLHPIRQEKELPAAVKMMVTQHPRSVFTIPLAEHVIDLTSQWDLPAVLQYLAENFPIF